MEALSRRAAAAGALLFLALCGGASPAGADQHRSPAKSSRNAGLAVLGVRVGVTDVPDAVHFYSPTLGFEVVEQTSELAVLHNGAFLMVLRQSDEASKVRFPGDAEAHLLFHVRSLKEALEELTEGKVATVDNLPRPAESGVFLTIKDRAGNLQELMEYRPRHLDLPKAEILEIAVEVPSLQRAREFYCRKLGFSPGEAGTEPASLQLHAPGVATIRLRETASRPSAAAYPKESATVILLGASDLRAEMAALQKRGVRFLGPVRSSPLGRYAAFRDPAGNVLELLQQERARPSAAAAKEASPLRLEATLITADDGSRFDAELGRLTVSENRSRPEGRKIELAFLRIKSTAHKPGAPIVYLAGGPGGSGTAAAKGSRLRLFLALREVADVIALDQRGTGLSRPDLTCAGSWSSPLDRPADPEEILALAVDRSRTCRETLSAFGIDLSAYNTEESASDLEDLRRALGVPKISLLGISYGTNLSLAAIRGHESGLQSVVLAGVEGPDQVLRLPSVLDAQLASLRPGLPANLERLLRRLESQPATVEVVLPLANRKAQVTVGKFDLQWMVAQALGSREGIRRLPDEVQAMEKGDFSALGAFAVNARRGWLGSAMPYAVQCSSIGSPERLARLKREAASALLGVAANFPFPELCDAWGVRDLGPGFRAPVHSALPALFISGTLDTRTPLADAEEVRRSFSASARLILEGAAHGDDLLLASPEIGRVIVRFLRGEPVGESRIAVGAAP
jgi:pimeloyl-ACP methyl ester carboxylesterase/catechol 2,3-dioxygenase-like lactoylglutathione lyase family enzyme